MTDRELLNQLARHRSEDAFNEIVRHHVDLVHSAAFRQLGNADTARDITQNVFILLAKQAKQLKPNVILTGWLYRTTRNLCLEHIRKDQRRRERERAAADHLMNTTAADQWEHVASELEPAMDELNDTERHAVLLRFFKNKSLREVGIELGIGEDAAQKRVGRALDRLRDIFSKRGVTLSTTALAAAISGSAIQAAPAAVITTVSTAALGAGLTAAVTSATLNTTTTMTTLFNFKTAAAVIAAAAVTGTSTYLVKEKESDRLRAEQSTMSAEHSRIAEEQQQALATIQLRDDQIASLKRDVADVPRLRGEIDRLNRELIENQRLLAASKRLRSESESANRKLVRAMAEITAVGKDPEQIAFDYQVRAGMTDLKQLGLAFRVYANDHSDELPNLTDFAEQLGKMKSAGDLSEDFDLNDYEQICFGNFDAYDPGTVLFRQRTPMVAPDGRRLKIYGLMDGSVQLVSELSVGPFDQFERSWTQNREPLVLPR